MKINIKKLLIPHYIYLIMFLTISSVSVNAQFEPVFELSSLNGNNGFVIEGIEIPAIHIIKKSISSVGDINGDGISDIVIGNPNADSNGHSYSGVSHIVYGKKSFDKNFYLSDFDGINGFVINGANTLSSSGQIVSSIDDINGDGVDDVFIGAYAYDDLVRNDVLSYVVFGNTNGFASMVELSEIDDTNGFLIKADPLIGMPFNATSLSSIDINGDGFNDLIIGTSSSQEVYAVLGKPNGLHGSINISELDGQNGFTISETPLNGTMSNAGDVNGDGIDDLIIGGKYSNTSYVVFGSNNGFVSAFDLATLNGNNGFKLEALDSLGPSRSVPGNSVSSAGDINADGIDDLIIGTSNATTSNGLYSGASHIVYGSRQNFPPMIELSSLNGTNGFSILGINPVDFFGGSVSELGDVNGDGISDIIIGANKVNSNGVDSGSSYVIFGNSDGFPQSFDLLSLNGDNGFVVNGINSGDNLGRKVSSAGDINGDGIDDIIIAAYTELFGPQLVTSSVMGDTYVVFGKSKNQISNNFDLQAGHSALWYNPEQNGHGINVYMLADNRIIVIWYVYDDEGNQVWLLGVGTHDGVKATLDVTYNDGAMFPPNFNSTDVNTVSWGKFELEFSGCDAGLFKWLPIAANGFTSGETAVVRLNNTLGLTCLETNTKNVELPKIKTQKNKTGDFAMQAAHSALWYNPDQSGHGLNVYMLADNRIIVIWYVYDNQGKQVWLLGVGTHDGVKATLDVTITSGSMFPPNFNADDISSNNWGQFELEFSGCNAGLFKWSPVDGNGYTAGETNVVRLNNTLGLTCNN